jgi:tRNA A37 methylthiotransferase MiaB
MQLADRLRDNFAAAQIGQTVQVLFETRQNATFTGTSDRYLRTCVMINHDSLIDRGSLVDVMVTSSDGDKLTGHISSR